MTNRFKPTEAMLESERAKQRERVLMVRPQQDWLLYALKLEQGKYYIGRTHDVLWRYKTHAEGKGSQWTSKHRPLALIETKRIEDSLRDKPDLAESKLTIEYMARYGWENVRGGDFTSVDDITIETKLVASGLMPVIETLKLRLPTRNR
ncbi:GIY-YIG nuclease family protein [Oxalobacteraceae bacterium]|nr:GIY-YIG nuclease family protein [Oxalobacteraceae bacterium]